MKQVVTKRADNAAAEMLRWVAETHPRLYAALVKRSSGLGAFNWDFTELITGSGPAQMSPIVESATSSTSIMDLLNTGLQLVPAYLGYQNQRDLYKLNLERAKAGMSPITMDQVGGAPGVPVDVRTTPATTATILGVPAILAIGGVAIALIMMSGRKSGRR